MATDAAAPSLGDFFKSKGKKKIKASNLNKESTTAKPDDKKKVKSAEDENWDEEHVPQASMGVGAVAGKLVREEEKKDDDDSAAPAWKKRDKEFTTTQVGGRQMSDKSHPTLAKSVGAVNIDDGSDAKVNIQTTRNHFAALEGEGSDDEEGGPKAKRPKEIKPAMVTKKKGEFEKVALQREVDKYTKKPIKKKLKKKDEDEEDEESEEEEEEEEAEEAPEEKDRKKQPEKKEKKKKEEKEEADEAEEDEREEDVKMQVDLAASKEKYVGRKKLAEKDLPRSEMQEQKENKKPVQAVGGKKKKFFAEEETEKKLAYADW